MNLIGSWSGEVYRQRVQATHSVRFMRCMLQKAGGTYLLNGLANTKGSFQINQVLGFWRGIEIVAEMGFTSGSRVYPSLDSTGWTGCGRCFALFTNTGEVRG